MLNMNNATIFNQKKKPKTVGILNKSIKNIKIEFKLKKKVLFLKIQRNVFSILEKEIFISCTYFSKHERKFLPIGIQ